MKADGCPTVGVVMKAFDHCFVTNTSLGALAVFRAMSGLFDIVDAVSIDAQTARCQESVLEFVSFSSFAGVPCL